MSYVNFNRALTRAQIEALGEAGNATNGKIYFAKDGGIYVGNAEGAVERKADYTPLMEKTFAPYTCTAANEAKGYIALFNVHPISDNWVTPWHVRYILDVDTSNTNCKGHYECYISQAGSQLPYMNWNELYSSSYYPIYNHMVWWHNTDVKYGNRETYPVKIGVRIYSAYGATTVSRTFRIRIIEMEGCTVDFLDAPATRDSFYDSTNYTESQPNGYSTGLQETGDANTIPYQLYDYGTSYLIHSTSTPLYRYKICGFDGQSRLIPISLTNQTSGTAVNQTPCSVPMVVSKGLVFYNTTTNRTAATERTGSSTIYRYWGPSTTWHKYNFSSMPLPYNDVYLKGTYDPATDEFTLDTTSSTSYYAFVPQGDNGSSIFENGYYYWYVGYVSGTVYSDPIYYADFTLEHPLFYYNGTSLVPASLSGSAKDWQENSSADPKYIQNRTHYITKGEEKELLTYGGAVFPDAISGVALEKYIIPTSCATSIPAGVMPMGSVYQLVETDYKGNTTGDFYAVYKLSYSEDKVDTSTLIISNNYTIRIEFTVTSSGGVRPTYSATVIGASATGTISTSTALPVPGLTGYTPDVEKIPYYYIDTTYKAKEGCVLPITSEGVYDTVKWESGTGTNSVQQKNTEAIAIGNGSVAEGVGFAYGDYSHAEGANSPLQYLNLLFSGAANTTTYTIDTVPTVIKVGDVVSFDKKLIAMVTAVSTTSPYSITVDSTLNPSAAVTDVPLYHIYGAIGDYSHAEGAGTVAVSSKDHAEGVGTEAYGYYMGGSHAEGYNTFAGYSNDTENTRTVLGTGAQIPQGVCCHAEGNGTEAIARWSHAEGRGTFAAGDGAHAEGNLTKATGDRSHAEGGSTEASGAASHAEGQSTIAQNSYEHAQGRYNVSNQASTSFGDAGNTIHSVGIGTAANAQKNAFEIMQNGDAYLYGLGTYVGINPTTGVNDIKTIINSKTSSTDIKKVGFAQDIFYNPIGTYDTYISLFNHDKAQATAQDPKYAVEAISTRTEDNKYFIDITLGNLVRQSYTNSNNNYPLAIAGMQYSNMTSGNCLPVYYSPNVQVNPNTGVLTVNDVSIGGTSAATAISNLSTNKQDKLVSGTNIKTVNNNSLLGSGNVSIATPGTLNTNNSSAQSVSSSEALSGTIKLHKVAKTGTYSDLINTPWKVGDGVESACIPGRAENYADGSWSVAHGSSYDEINDDSVQGAGVYATGMGSSAEGMVYFEDIGAYASVPETKIWAKGNGSHAEGCIYLDAMGGETSDKIYNLAAGVGSHAEGSHTIASGNYSHAEGFGYVVMPGVTISGSANATTYTCSPGSTDLVVGDVVSINMEKFCMVIDVPTDTTITLNQTLSSSSISGRTIYMIRGAALGDSAHAEGDFTTALGMATHAEGNGTTAIGNYSHAEGYWSQAQNRAEHAEGNYNASHVMSGTYAYGNAANTTHSIGIGTATDARKNAFEVMENGDTYLYGLGTYDGTNPTTGVNDIKTIINSKIGSSDIDSTLSSSSTNPVQNSAIYEAIGDIEAALNQILVGTGHGGDWAIATTQGTGMVPNKMYELGTLTDTVTFTLAPITNPNVVNHYYWTFETGSTAPTITWPTGITWDSGNAPTINVNRHYEISIINNVGAYMEV